MQSGSDRARRGNQTNFARSLRSVSTHFVGNFDQDDVNLRRLLGAQDSAIAEEKGIRHTICGSEILGKGIAKTHVHAAFDLPRASLWVDGVPDIVSCYYALHSAIVIKNHELTSVAEGHVRRGIFQRFGRTRKHYGAAAVLASSIRHHDHVVER